MMPVDEGGKEESTIGGNLLQQIRRSVALCGSGRSTGSNKCFFIYLLSQVDGNAHK